MPYYGKSFYKNVCSLLASINSGIVHRRPSVKLPLTKAGLELSQVLANLGIISGYSVGQRLSKVHGHSRLWEGPPAAAAAPAAAGPGASPAATYAGLPGMYLTLQLNWDKHKPLSSSALVDSSSSSGNSAAAARFSPPMSLHSPTPERVKIISKPSHQRWVGLQQLLAARAALPPGVFLLSTHQGLLTDIDAELRGLGGILLGHLTLPLAHTLQLRGLLRAKYQQEAAAAAAAATSGVAQAGASPSQQQQQQVRHEPLQQWDARVAAGRVVSRRLQQLAEAAPAAGEAYMREVVFGADDKARQQRSAAAQEKLTLLRLQEMLWRRHQAGQQQQPAGGGSSSSNRARWRRGP